MSGLERRLAKHNLLVYTSPVSDPHPKYSREIVPLIFLFLFPASSLVAQVAVTTYHYDNNRTGWNKQEKVLTPANVTSTTFGLLRTVALDDQVDAQPLVIPGVLITAGSFQGTHDVAYVATEGNTVYAIDAEAGTVLLSSKFGTPVSNPLGCINNGPNVGINSTPAIDVATKTIYIMVYTQGAGGPAYYLHALDLGSLTDKVKPQLVAASHALSNGSMLSFNAKYQRQRPGLLLKNGSIYAGFGSFCDIAASRSRGWMLGWSAGTLAPFVSNQLNDQLPNSPNNYFLSSVWMAGYAPAADDDGNILFVTGNSDPSGSTYNGTTNIQESAVKMSPTLSTVIDLFTPNNQPELDNGDLDFGSGGLLMLPDQPGSTPHLAVAAGKNGSMYLMNEDSLGGFASPNNVLGTYSIGGCWCGPSYFAGANGKAWVVSSGGRTVMVWKLLTSPAAQLAKVAESASIGGIQDAGFFTTVSSNGPLNPIIWALSRPQNAAQAVVDLLAFNPGAGGTTLTPIFKSPAGTWPNLGGDSNLIPVVADGQVFVASNKQLQIFGLLP